MNIVIAIDSLKGSLTSLEAGHAIAEGIRRVDPAVTLTVKPLADEEGRNGGSTDLWKNMYRRKKYGDGTSGIPGSL